MRRVLLVLAFPLILAAQSSMRNVVLTWEDTKNPTGTTYSIYRTSGQCATATSFTKITSDVAAKTYTDRVNPGLYCYHATANFNNQESDPSDPAEQQVKPYKVEKFTTTIPVEVTVTVNQ